MLLSELKDAIDSLQHHGDLQIKMFDGSNRLRDFDVSLELGGVDNKDKHSMYGNLCVVVYGVKTCDY